MEGSDVSSWAARQAGGEVPGTMDVGDDAAYADDEVTEEGPVGIQAQLEATQQSMRDLAEVLDQEIHHADRRLVTEDEVADAEDVVQALKDNADALAEMCAKVGERQAELDKENEDAEAEDDDDDDDLDEDDE